MPNAHSSASIEAITSLPITNRPGQSVTLCGAGYAHCRRLRIGALYMSMDGAGKYGYVTFTDMSAPGEAATLARALAGAGRGQRVRYHDRDVTNLRLSNLYIERGGAKGPTPRASAQLGGDI